MEHSQEAILERVRTLNTWRKGDERAPHKPLLILLSLARLAQGSPRLSTFTELEIPLANLLKNYGPPRASFHPEYPFWRLQRDGLWEVEDSGSLRRRRGNTDPLKSELKKKRVKGGLPEWVYQQFHNQPAFMAEIVRELLDQNFPSSLHEDILDELGLSMPLCGRQGRRNRDGQFRTNVINAYAHCCAICGFDMKIGPSDFALDAAHIKWHQAGGPDIISNGLALCSIHHKALDRGVIGITDDRRVLISVELHGNSWAREWLEGFNGESLRRPARSEWHPKVEYLRWHHRWVFHKPARD
jgi:putative restriction endonuclease